MAKVIFTISYEINPEKRPDYLALSQAMREHFKKINGREYSIFEQKGKKNNFTEVFIFNSIDDYHQLDDQDDRMVELVQQLEGMLTDSKMKYSTLIELE